MSHATRTAMSHARWTTTHVYTAKRPRKRLRGSLLERFWAQVQKTDGCWMWTGAKDHSSKDCYGRIQDEGGRGSKLLNAHRVAYELLVGPIPNSLCVLHCCDNPSCVNPSHLFLGTKADNLRDMTSKGRRARGERVGGAKLTEQEIKEIRAQYRRYSKEFGGPSLGRRYGVAENTIRHVVRGETWRQAS